MKVQPLSNDNFGAIKPVKGSISKEVYDAVSKSDVLKRFGRDFNAEVSQGSILSTSTGKPRMALKLENIRPVNPFIIIKNIISGKRPVNTIWLKTHAKNENDFIASIYATNANYLISNGWINNNFLYNNSFYFYHIH